ncbi:MAG TPA: four helix bundle protein [Balneolaceae bacterium]|nr:four helix bundle protein [Balneola sp.]HBQ59723.1 four helix bundle protein [Balneolaceae bacterium]|tara:strand:+ start:21842 stop:22192 length:351 start_codon:yes stop_codon:yes gene_type:complete
MKENVIQGKSFDFALTIISLYKILQKEREYIISSQLLRSGTSIGANIEEAIAGQSKKDFLHKVSISLKEARETRYWLRLLKESKLTNYDLDVYLNESLELINILSAIVKTTRQRLD